MATTIGERRIDTPVGVMRITTADERVTGIWLKTDGAASTDRATGVIAEAERQLRAYFDGALTTFDLPLAPKGTEFQRSVWTALQRVPFGETTSYGALARAIGRPDAVRAVGAANGQNPIPIVIPCHRVIGSNGALTGFGGGLPMKAWLLRHESRQPRLGL